MRGVPLACSVAVSVPNLVSSDVAAVDAQEQTSEESLSRATSWLVGGGMTIRMACGMTIESMRPAGDMPSDRAASIWPRGTAWMPARKVSAR